RDDEVLSARCGIVRQRPPGQRSPRTVHLVLLRSGQGQLHANCLNSTCMRSSRMLPLGMRGLLALLLLAIAATAAAAGVPIFDAIAAGDKTAVEQALADGADVDSR